MSVVEEAFVKVMKDAGGISAIVAARVYPAVIPQSGSLPCITYQRISGPRLRDLDGADGIAMPRFQVNCWATTYKGAFDLETAVRAVLQDYTGTVLSVVIHDVELEDSGDLFEPSVGVNYKRRFGRRMDFIVWHSE